MREVKGQTKVLSSHVRGRKYFIGELDGYIYLNHNNNKKINNNNNNNNNNTKNKNNDDDDDDDE